MKRNHNKLRLQLEQHEVVECRGRQFDMTKGRHKSMTEMPDSVLMPLNIDRKHESVWHLWMQRFLATMNLPRQILLIQNPRRKSSLRSRLKQRRKPKIVASEKVLLRKRLLLQLVNTYSLNPYSN
jgi:hypothetical protein